MGFIQRKNLSGSGCVSPSKSSYSAGVASEGRFFPNKILSSGKNKQVENTIYLHIVRVIVKETGNEIKEELSYLHFNLQCPSSNSIKMFFDFV